MTETRKSHAQEKRESREGRSEAVRAVLERDDTWNNPGALLDPDPIPGIAYRWIRKSMLGTDDARNVSKKMREGWTPAPASEHPKFREFANESTDNIEYGGLILCWTSQKMVDQRNAYFSEKARRQIEAVDRNFMSQSNPRMPLLQPERRSRESFGEGEP